MTKRKMMAAIAVAATGAPLPQDDLTIPAFLKRTGPIMSHAEAHQLALESTGAFRTWAPFRDPESRVEPPKVLFVDDRTYPVQVTIRQTKVALATYADMNEFDAKHDHKQYPVSKTVSVDAKTASEMHGQDRGPMTIILVNATPWAGRVAGPKKERVPGALGAKAQLIADLLLRPEGCTTKDVLSATGWPAVSMPAQAKIAGLALRKEKVGKETRYWGAKNGEAAVAASVAKVEPMVMSLTQRMLGTFEPPKVEEPAAPKAKPVKMYNTIQPAKAKRKSIIKAKAKKARK